MRNLGPDSSMWWVSLFGFWLLAPGVCG